MLPHRIRARLFLALLLSATIGGCLSRQQPELASAAASPQTNSTQSALAPLDFVSFCMRNKAQCRATGPSDALVEATSEAMATIENVNRQVNARIQPTDAVAEWRINPTVGNCNDYVVSKRHALLARGFPSSALLINVVKTPAGEGHLVLVVKTDHGDLVLDNLTASLRKVSQTPYLWIKRQTPADPWQWENA